MFSQILYCVLERYTLSHNTMLNGKINGSGSRVPTNTENWIESMENQWNSSEKKFPGFTTCRFSPTSKEWWVKWSVHQNKTKEESSSCRRMTSHGEIWRTRRFVFPSMWPTMQEDSLSDIGHSSGPDQKRHGTAQTLTNFADNRTESLKSWWLIFLSGHPIFRATSALERRTLTSKGGGRLSIHFCGDYWYSWSSFSHHYFCQSAQYLRSSSRLVWRIGSVPVWQTINWHGETQCNGKTRVTGFTCGFLERFETTSDQSTGKGKPVARPRKKEWKTFLIMINW